MSYIKITFRKVEDAHLVLEQASRALEDISAQLVSVRASLDSNILTRYQNGERLDAAVREAQSITKRTRDLGRTVEKGLEQYRKTEQKLRGKAAQLKL